MESEQAVKIITQHIKDTISMTSSDWWVAIFDNYDEGDPQGRGSTEDEAIVDLMEKHYQGESA